MISRVLSAAGRLMLAATALTFALRPAAVEAQARSIGVDTTAFDRSVRPQDDFFRFANGAWLKSTPIPEDATSWGSFDILAERSREAMRAVLEEASRAKAPAGSETQKVGDLYASFMDSARVESLGLAPLKAELDAIAAIRTASQLPKAFAHFARVGVPRPLGVSVGPDRKQSSANIVQIGQSGLGLPDRDYYLQQDARMVAIRKAYQDYGTRLL